jgi:hypothetical protein
MRSKIKIITVATTSTKQQVEDAINAQLTKGWVFTQMYIYTTNWWIVFRKEIVA